MNQPTLDERKKVERKSFRLSPMEWIVIVAVIGMLIAMLFPAIQAARESPHRLSNQDKSTEMVGYDYTSTPPMEASKSVDLPETRYAKAMDGQAANFTNVHFAQNPGGALATPAIDHKIIYSATINLVVENFDGEPEKVAELVKKFDGYLADTKLSSASTESRHGEWKVRIPVARFDEFVAAAKGLGERQNVNISSNDVSEEYYDVEARIRNKTKEEERLLRLLEERPGNLADVIAIERELSRVREELERMQGRMRVLADLTSLTTVTLSIQEIHNYQPAEAPTLATRVKRTFGDSVESLGATGTNLLLLATAIAPWLPVAAILLGVIYMLIRRRRAMKPA